MFTKKDWHPKSELPQPETLNTDGTRLFFCYSPVKPKLQDRFFCVRYSQSNGWEDGSISHWSKMPPEPTNVAMKTPVRVKIFKAQATHKIFLVAATGLADALKAATNQVHDNSLKVTPLGLGDAVIQPDEIQKFTIICKKIPLYDCVISEKLLVKLHRAA